MFEHLKATRAELGRRFYGSDGDYRRAVASFDIAHKARLKARNDLDGLAAWEAARPKVSEFAAKHRITPTNLHTTLAVVLEREQFPQSAEALEKQRPRTKESLARHYGGAAAAEKYIRGYVEVTTDLAKQIPYLAALANKIGAAEDERLVKALGRMPTEAAKE